MPQVIRTGGQRRDDLLFGPQRDDTGRLPYLGARRRTDDVAAIAIAPVNVGAPRLVARGPGAGWRRLICPPSPQARAASSASCRVDSEPGCTAACPSRPCPARHAKRPACPMTVAAVAFPSSRRAIADNARCATPSSSNGVKPHHAIRLLCTDGGSVVGLWSGARSPRHRAQQHPITSRSRLKLPRRSR
jgi:hypothetical protein